VFEQKKSGSGNPYFDIRVKTCGNACLVEKPADHSGHVIISIWENSIDLVKDRATNFQIL